MHSENASSFVCFDDIPLFFHSYFTWLYFAYPPFLKTFFSLSWITYNVMYVCMWCFSNDVHCTSLRNKCMSVSFLKLLMFAYMCPSLLICAYRCLSLLSFAYLCFYLLIFAYTCLSLLIPAYLCLYLLIFAYTCLSLLIHAYLCLYMLIFAYTCCLSLLKFAHPCIFLFVLAYLCLSYLRLGLFIFAR